MTPEHKAAIAEGKARAAAARAAAIEEEVSDTLYPTVQVVYRPLDGDPHSTVWNGIKFQANVPVELDRRNPAHFIEQLLPKQITSQNGEVQTKHAPAKVFMGDLAKGNPSFEVDGNRAMKLVNKRVLPAAGHGWAEDHEDQISNAW